MKGAEIDKKALEINKGTFARLGVEWCENCGSSQWLTIAHRQKRRHYKHKDPIEHIKALTQYSEILMLCQPCHEQAERSQKVTEEFFARLR